MEGIENKCDNLKSELKTKTKKFRFSSNEVVKISQKLDEQILKVMKKYKKR